MDEVIEFKEAGNLLAQSLAVLAGREGAPAGLCDPSFAPLLMELLRLVLERNKEVNLTSIKEPSEFVRLHLLDSLACVGMPELEAAHTIIDIGSGAGFPGLPLAALYPDKQFLLMDSVRKKIDFAGVLAKELRLSNVSALHARAEASARDPSLREQFDLSLCRAVGKFSPILEYCMPFVRVGGAGFYYKTIGAKEELADSLPVLELLGGSLKTRTFTYEDILPGYEHAIYVISKERPTPPAYPRRAGIPTKTPL